MKKNKTLNLFLLLFLLVLNSCSSIKTVTTKHQFPLKIAIMGDSQITTNKGTFNYGMRKKLADKFVNVAVRPAGVEYLAADMLKYFLYETKFHDVDVILYLGDGANSGCKDELDTIFMQLSSFRRKHKIPIYYTIGNHDYLGAGNQAIKSVRENLCDNGFANNPPQSKKQIIELIRKFNLTNKYYDKNFKYQEVYSLPNIADNNFKDDSHFYSYYGAILNYNKDNTNIEFFLMDTSDYANTIFKPHELWGIKGGISYQTHNYGQNSQINNFIISSKDNNPDYRFIASHYQPATNMTPSTTKDDLIKLLKGKNNYWLSAHSHIHYAQDKKYKIGKFFDKKVKLLGLNVGSTTDYYPHFVILEQYSGHNKKIDHNLGYRIIKHENNSAICSEIFGYVKNNISQFQTVSGSKNVETILGINKAYRSENWSGVDVKRVRENIDYLKSKASLINKNINQRDIVFCLAMIGAKNELSFWDKFKSKFGF